MRLNTAWQWLLIASSLLCSGQTYSLDCASKKNADSLIEIFAIARNPDKNEYQMKIFVPEKFDEFKLASTHLGRGSGTKKEGIFVEVKMKPINGFMVGTIFGDLAELERWIVMISYYLEDMKPPGSDDFECPTIFGQARVKHHKPYTEMDAAKRNTR